MNDPTKSKPRPVGEPLRSSATQAETPPTAEALRARQEAKLQRLRAVIDGTYMPDDDVADLPAEVTVEILRRTGWNEDVLEAGAQVKIPRETAERWIASGRARRVPGQVWLATSLVGGVLVGSRMEVTKTGTHWVDQVVVTRDAPVRVDWAAAQDACKRLPKRVRIISDADAAHWDPSVLPPDRSIFASLMGRISAPQPAPIENDPGAGHFSAEDWERLYADPEIPLWESREKARYRAIRGLLVPRTMKWSAWFEPGQEFDACPGEMVQAVALGKACMVGPSHSQPVPLPDPPEP